MPLTDLQVKGAKAKSKQYKLSDQAGVCLVVKPTGLKVFYLRYRYFGKEKMLSLGTYPQTSLAQARELANSTKQLLKQNFDPSQVRKAEKYKHEKGETFMQITKAWCNGQ